MTSWFCFNKTLYILRVINNRYLVFFLDNFYYLLIKNISFVVMIFNTSQVTLEYIY